MPQVSPDKLNGITIPHEVARAALGMGRDAFAAALKRGDIPSVKLGKRYFVLGQPFRQLVGIEAPSARAA